MNKIKKSYKIDPASDVEGISVWVVTIAIIVLIFSIKHVIDVYYAEEMIKVKEIKQPAWTGQ